MSEAIDEYDMYLLGLAFSLRAKVAQTAIVAADLCWAFDQRVVEDGQLASNWPSRPAAASKQHEH